MRKLMIAALVAAQAVSAPAATIVSDHRVAAQEAGSFAGARVRLALGGKPGAPALRAGLVLAPTLRSGQADGRVVTRFGEGLEWGVAGDFRPGLSVAGHRADGRQLPELRRRMGVSTLGWVAIGVGAAALIVVGASAICIESNCLGSE